MDTVLTYVPAWAWPYLDKITPQQWWYAVNTLFLLAGLLVAMFAYYCFRRACGFEKFKGEWYGREDLQKLKQELYSGVLEGRLPDVETMRFLDKHIYGRESQFRQMSGRGWL